MSRCLGKCVWWHILSEGAKAREHILLGSWNPNLHKYWLQWRVQWQSRDTRVSEHELGRGRIAGRFKNFCLFHLLVSWTWVVNSLSFHLYKMRVRRPMGFPGGSVRKNPPAMQGTAWVCLGSIPGWGRSSGEGNGNPLQYSCLGNPMEQRRLVGFSPWGLKSWMQLSD